MPALPAPPTGRLDGPLHLFAVRVYHEDTDATGRVYHGAYLRWFERARSDILELLGIDQRAASERGRQRRRSTQRAASRRARPAWRQQQRAPR